MLAALIIVFREVLEAGLIIGIALAVTRGVRHGSMWIGGAVAAGLFGSCVVAFFVGAIAQALGGAGQEIFNFGILSTATIMLVWHNLWMAQHGREIAAGLRSAGEAVRDQGAGLAGLAVVVLIAVLREGSEVVLFLYGIAASGGQSATEMAIGSAAGLAMGAGVGAVAYFGLLTLPTKQLFKTTTVLIGLLAAGMAAQAVGFLEQAAILPQGDPLWDTSELLSDKSLLGRALHTLIGYTDQPTAMQLAVYIAVVGLNVLLIRYSRSARGHSLRRQSS